MGVLMYYVLATCSTCNVTFQLLFSCLSSNIELNVGPNAPMFRFSFWYLETRLSLDEKDTKADNFGSSFFSECLKEWNDLAPEIQKKLTTVSPFESKLFFLVQATHKLSCGIYNT